MSNGIGGFIDDVTKKAMDEYLKAKKIQDNEVDALVQRAKAVAPPEEYGTEQYTEPKIREALDSYYKADDDAKDAYHKMLDSGYIKSRERDEDYYGFLEDQMGGLKSKAQGDFEGVLGWLDGLFGQAGDLFGDIDVNMPMPDIIGLEALGLLPNLLMGFTQTITKLFTIDEETFVEDTIKMLALTDKLKEKLGEVVK